MPELVGSILGKKVYVSRNQIACTESELREEFGNFGSLHLLRFVADLGHSIFLKQNRIDQFGGVPLADDFLLFCGLIAIQSCVPKARSPDAAERKRLLQMAHYQYDQLAINQAAHNPTNLLTVFAHKYFMYQESPIHSLSRAIYLYQEVWDRVVKDLPSREMFLRVIGLSLEAIVGFLLAFNGAPRSYHFGFTKSQLSDLRDKTRLDISIESERVFLNWISADYGEIRNYDGSLSNPLVKYPIVDTKEIPDGTTHSVYLIISKTALFHRISSSLYFDFMEFYSGSDGANSFKDRFGFVFQEYIGDLLKHHFRSWEVIPEIEYGKDHQKLSTVDWILFKENKLVLIEVKQSSVFYKTKSTGSIESLESDIQKTIGKAIKQLDRTEAHIQLGTLTELKQFQAVTMFQKVCVVADPVYFSNMMIPEIVRSARNTHIINVSEFEAILALQERKQGLFYLLHQKTENEKTKAMDFTEFLVLKYPKRYSNLRVSFLTDYYRSFSREIMGLRIAS